MNSYTLISLIVMYFQQSCRLKHLSVIDYKNNQVMIIKPFKSTQT